MTDPSPQGVDASSSLPMPAPVPPTGFRVTSLRAAVDAELNRLEAVYAAADDPGPRDCEEDLPRIPTGVPAIDLVLGGIPAAAATVISSDHGVLNEVVATAIALLAPGPVLLAGPDIGRLCRTLISASSGVPYALLESGHLLEPDWVAVAAACRRHATDRIRLTESPSPWRIDARYSAALGEIVVLLGSDWPQGEAERVRDMAIAHRRTMIAFTQNSTTEADAILVRPTLQSGSLMVVGVDQSDGLRTATAGVDLLARALR